MDSGASASVVNCAQKKAREFAREGGGRKDHSSGIVYDFHEGEVVTIVLNSVGPEGGKYQLNIHELDHAVCPYTRETEGVIPTLGREFESDCGGVGPAATIQLGPTLE